MRERLAHLTGAMAQTLTGPLAAAKAHFLRVTASYEPGLFWCYDVPGVPRTNNAVEQFFGAVRYHRRRATGRKQGGPGFVVRGAARVIAAAAHPLTAADLAEVEPTAWAELRTDLDRRRDRRRDHRRFRQDPEGYLRELEARLPQPSLPA